MARLKDTYRVALVLHYFERKPLKEVARIVGCTLSTTKWRVHRARKQLGAILATEMEHHE